MHVNAAVSKCKKCNQIVLDATFELHLCTVLLHFFFLLVVECLKSLDVELQLQDSAPIVEEKRQPVQVDAPKSEPNKKKRKAETQNSKNKKKQKIAHDEKSNQKKEIAEPDVPASVMAQQGITINIAYHGL